MYVYRAAGGIRARRRRRRRADRRRRCTRLTEDVRLPLDLDIGLRPEGKNGAVVRSLDSYRAYYERWSLTWEAQALLRARVAAGDADAAAGLRGARRRGALPGGDRREGCSGDQTHQGAGRVRAAAAGGRSVPALEARPRFAQRRRVVRAAAAAAARRTHRELENDVDAGGAGRRRRGRIWSSETDANRLREAWLFASRTRSAMTLWMSKTTDVLPGDRVQLEGVARLMGYPPGSANRSRTTTCASPAGHGTSSRRSSTGCRGRAGADGLTRLVE